MFGKAVRAHRQRLGLSQEGLAERTGISVRSISSLEAGRVTTPRASTVRLLADAFGLTDTERDRFCATAFGATAGSIPAQLPADVYGFTGRTDELARLDTLLEPAGTVPAAVVISAVSGTAGVGKTALAVHWAHRVAAEFPDGQLYVNLRGYDAGGQTMAASEAVRGFLDAFGVPPERVPPSLDAQVGLYRSLLAGRRMLLVLDNARDAEQIRPLLPGTPTAFAVVTSRNRLTGLVATEAAKPIVLDVLSTEDARELLARRLGTHRVAAEPDPTDRIINCCAHLPLALAIAAAHGQYSDLPLTSLAADLERAGARLDVLDGGELSSQVRAVFSWSYQTLSPDAARLFRLLGLLPYLELSAPAAASLAAFDHQQVRTAIDELLRANLIAERTPSRYTCHDLLRLYAADLTHTVDTDELRRCATGRLLDHYLHTAHAAARTLYPARDTLPLTPPQPGVVPERPADALAWLATEQAVLIATIEHARSTGFAAHAWRLAWTIADYLDRQGHWHGYTTTAQVGLAAAQQLDDPAAVAAAHRNLAYAYTRLDRYPDAHEHLQQALDDYQRIGDLVGQARSELNLAVIAGRQHGHAEALDHARRALDLFQAADHSRGQAQALNAIGWHHAKLGHYQQALIAGQHALSWYQQLEDHYGQAASWDTLGYAHHQLRHHTQAISCYGHAIDLYRKLNDGYWQADTLTHLGDTHLESGNAAAARHAWRHAMDILTDLEHPDAKHVYAKLTALDDHPLAGASQEGAQRPT